MRETIADLYWDGTKFNDLFIQLFVYQDHKINLRLLNKFLEADLSYKQFCDIAVDISGSKLIPFRPMELYSAKAFYWFTDNYKFGEFEDVVEWVQHIYESTGEVVPRSVIFQHIKELAPKRAAGSFAPVGMAQHDYRESNAASQEL